MPEGPIRWMAPATAFAAADAQARFDSRNFIFPHIKRTVKPVPYW